MNTFTELSSYSLVVRLGWTLVHFIWQGFALAFLLAAAFGLRRKATPVWRYNASCAALVLMMLAPVATFLFLSFSHGHTVKPGSTSIVQVVSTVSRTTLATPFGANPFGQSTVSFLAMMESSLPILVAVWLLGVVILSTRLAGSWWRLKQLRVVGTEPLGEPWTARLAGLAAQLHINRPVTLLKSALVEVPTVIGWLRPVILLPACSITGLTPSQLDAILVHELAHIARNDYLVNLFQRVAETALFYHPAVWWVSRCIREDRELCCDDIVVSICPDRADYARALASLEEMRALPATLAMAADGGGGSLLQRIQRLLGASPDKPKIKMWRIMLLLLAGGGLALATHGYFNFKAQPMYRATTRFVVNPDSGDPGNSADNPYWLATQLEIVGSRRIMLGVNDQLHLSSRTNENPGWAHSIAKFGAVDALQKRVTVRQIPGTSLVEVTACFEDRETAARIANSIFEVYWNYRRDKQAVTTDRKRRIFAEQITEQRTRLEELNAQYKKLQVEGPEQNKAASFNTQQTLREIDRQQKIYDDLAMRIAQDEVDSRANDSSPVQIVDAAEPPLRPIARW